MRCITICLTLAGLLGLLPAAAAPAAPAQDHDWGSPPKDDAVQFDAELPQTASWLSYIPGSNFPEYAGRDEQRLYITGENGVTAYDVKTGATDWVTPLDQTYMGFWANPGGDFVTLGDKDGMLVLAAVDGHRVFSLQGVVPLAVGSGFILGTRAKEVEKWPFWEGSNLLRIETSSGRILQELPLNQVSSAAIGPVGPDGQILNYAVSADGIHAFNATGEVWSTTAGGPGLGVAVTLTSAGLLLQEYTDAMQSEWPRRSDLKLRLLDPLSGKQLWVTKPALHEGSGFFDVPVQYVAGRIILFDRVYVNSATDGSSTSATGLTLIDPKDGSLTRQLNQPVYGEQFMQALSLDKGRLGLVFQVDGPADASGNVRANASYELRSVDTASGESAVFPLPNDLNYSYAGYGGRAFCGLSEIYDASGGGGSAFNFAYRLELGADGQALPQQPNLLGFSKLAVTAPAQFMANASPLADDALMRSVVSQGLTAMSQLSAQFPLMNEAQRAALLELSLYVEARENSEGVYFYPLRNFCEQLADLPVMQQDPAQLLRWCNDPRLAQYRAQLLGSLAMSGGDVARAALDKEYASCFDQSISPPGPPYGGGEAEAGPHQAAPGARVAAPSGDWYVPFVADYLPGQVVCLGQDNDGDGKYEAVYPTDLTNVYELFYYPLGYAAASGPPTPLAIKINGAFVTISHNVFVDQQASARDDIRPLADILRDSDGDGWSDLTEQRLFTNPQQADSDGDGLPDSQDRFPGIDPARMGRLERGVSRALYYVLVTQRAGDSPPDPPSPMPLDCEPLSVEGCGPVACHYLNSFMVCADSEAKRKQLEDFYAGGNSWDVSIWLASIKDGKRSDADDDAAFGRDVYKYSGEYVVKINFPGSGTEIELKDVNGELFPTNEVGGWIS